MSVPENHYYFNDAGLMVTTEAAHLARGYCCGNSCKYCPFEYEAVLDQPSIAGALTVRQAVASDAAAIAEVARQTFASTFGKDFENAGRDLVPYLRYSFAEAKISASLSKPENNLWVACDESNIVWGYLKLKLAVKAGDVRELHLQRLYMRRQAKGSGAAVELLRVAVAYVEKANATRLWLTCLKENARGLAFYEREGFEVEGDLTHDIGEQAFDFWVLGIRY